MDAFAVAVCKGLGMRRIQWGQAVVIALFFGGFQALMPLVGWAVGSMFSSYITAVDHWIAFGLLALIGAKMLWDAFHEEGSDARTCNRQCATCARRGTAACSDALVPLDFRELTMLAVATSIDALAVGITFAFLGVNIALAVVLIGVTTFALSLAGVVIGNQFGSRFEKPAAIAGGIVLARDDAVLPRAIFLRLTADDLVVANTIVIGIVPCHAGDDRRAEGAEAAVHAVGIANGGQVEGHAVGSHVVRGIRRTHRIGLGRRPIGQNQAAVEHRLLLILGVHLAQGDGVVVFAVAGIVCKAIVQHSRIPGTVHLGGRRAHRLVAVIG